MDTKILHLCLAFLCGTAHLFAFEGLRPSKDFPRYWEYRGEPVLLLGGSNKDNLFQSSDIEETLDALVAAGGNYIRNTMSDRDEGNARAFRRLPDGRYDLTQWNTEYWARFDNLLKQTAERDIFVQIEIWDRFDHSRAEWESDPYNPSNNLNYTHEETGLDAHYPQHPGRNLQPFFFTQPDLQDLPVLLHFQQAFVDRMLSISLGYDHILYCIDNETDGAARWSSYWASYVRKRAKAAGVPVFVTEMWGPRSLRAEEHRRTLNHPETYDFFEASQHSHISGDLHWARLVSLRDELEEAPMPINIVKIYGAEGARNGRSARDGLERFWRGLLAGVAAQRFHRPTSGLGLSEPAVHTMQSARLLASEVDLWRLNPDLSLLGSNRDTKAYIAAELGQTYVIYFTDGGQVAIDLTAIEGELQIRWIDTAKGQWGPTAATTGKGWRRLAAPGSGHWIAVIAKP